MWNAITETLPPQVLLGGLAVAAGCYLLAPEAGRRQAAHGALDRCVAAIEAEAAPIDHGDAGRRQTYAVLESLAQKYLGPLGGEVVKGLKPPPTMTRASTAPERCRCLLEASVKDSQVRLDLTLWLLSLRVYEEPAVADLNQAMADKHRLGHCRREGGA